MASGEDLLGEVLGDVAGETSRLTGVPGSGDIDRPLGVDPGEGVAELLGVPDVEVGVLLGEGLVEFIWLDDEALFKCDL